MNKYLKEFFHRGLIFGGFGPIILAIINFILSKTVEDFALTGSELLLGTVSIYFLAFIQAGATVFNQIENWPVTKSLLFHFGSLYIVYVLCYIINSWIPFKPMVLVIFTIIFAMVYFIVWITVFLSIKAFSKKANKKLK
ncbi:MAG: DUF3021 domain-containing protein [Clostridia bacterium]|nr:DUF3021 domain-containing protein [Clostridia bacterium]